MTEPVQIPAAEIWQRLGGESLRDWVQHQRWYASKSRAVASLDIVESLTLRDDPLLMLALVQTRFATGTHELYQLPLGLRPLSELDAPDSIVRGEEWTVYDALGDPAQARELLRRMDSGEETETADGRFSFHKTDLLRVSADDADVRPMGVEQSNSSLVFDEEMVLKVFRKLEPGVNPELEMLRFLTGHEFPNIAPLHGWYEYEGQALSTTLGVAQTFFPDARGGWELALEELG
jgi:maltokinase